MTTAKSGGGQRKAAAAARRKADAASKPKLEKPAIYGIELDLVDKIPPSFMIDVAILQSADGQPGDAINLLMSLGVTSDQIREYRAKVHTGEVEIPEGNDALTHLCQKLVEIFGVSLGE